MSQTHPTHPVDVSIVIPTYNRSHSLERTLRSIDGHTSTFSYAVTVIDDGSPDNTCQMLSQMQKQVSYPLQFHTQKNSGPAVARNLGISSTQSPYVVFLDDDHEVLPGWLNALCAPLSDPDVGFVNGKNDSVPDGGIAARYVCLRDERESDKVAADKKRYLTSGNAALHRTTLEKTKGFNPQYRAVFKGVAPGGEDTDLGMRICSLGLKIVYRPDALTLHYREMTLRKLFKERFNFGRNRIKWLRAEGRPATFIGILFRLFRTTLSMIAIPKKIVNFRKNKYAIQDCIAFAFLDKLTLIIYETGTFYGFVFK